MVYISEGAGMDHRSYAYPNRLDSQYHEGKARSDLIRIKRYARTAHSSCPALLPSSVTVNRSTRYVLCLVLPPIVTVGSLLHSPGRATVGVAVKPPDESFRRLET